MDWLTILLAIIFGVFTAWMGVSSIVASKRERQLREQEQANPERAVRISWTDQSGALVTKTFLVNFDDFEEVDRLLTAVRPIHRIDDIEIVRPPVGVSREPRPAPRRDLAAVG